MLSGLMEVMQGLGDPPLDSGEEASKTTERDDVAQGIYDTICDLIDQQATINDFLELWPDAGRAIDATVTLDDHETQAAGIARQLGDLVVRSVGHVLAKENYFQSDVAKIMSGEELQGEELDFVDFLDRSIKLVEPLDIWSPEQVQINEMTLGRTKCIMMIAKAREHEESHDILKAYAEAYMVEKNIVMVERPDDLSTFCKTMTENYDIQSTIMAFASKLASSPECCLVTPLVAKVVDTFQLILPSEVVHLLGDSVKCYNKLKSLAKQIAEGQSVGIMQAAQALNSAQAARKLVSDREDFFKPFQALVAHFESSVLETISWIDLPFLAKYVEGNLEIMGAIKAWDFNKKEVKWITTSNIPAERAALSKKSDLILHNAPSAVRVVEDVAGIESTIPRWCSDSVCKKIKDAKGDLIDFHSKLQTMSVQNASILLANCILTGVQLESAKTMAYSKWAKTYLIINNN